jgi:broad specificity phosphatase PhoE
VTRQLCEKKGVQPGRRDSFCFSAPHLQEIEAGWPITVTTLLRRRSVFGVTMSRFVRALDRGIHQYAPEVKLTFGRPVRYNHGYYPFRANRAPNDKTRGALFSARECLGPIRTDPRIVPKNGGEVVNESRDSRQQKWMDDLVIIRHGESERNVQKAAALTAGLHEYGANIRDMDVPLTQRGITQATETGKYLASKFRFDRAFTSPYLRALETTRIMLRQFKRTFEITLEERIREKVFGILDGLTKAGIQHNCPVEFRRREPEEKYYYRPPGGESYPDVALRTHSFLGTLTRDYQRKSVLLVCHSVVVLVFRRLLERLTEMELLAIDRDPDQEVDNCSVTWYAFDSKAGAQGKMLLREFNGVHYERQLESP